MNASDDPDFANNNKVAFVCDYETFYKIFFLLKELNVVKCFVQLITEGVDSNLEVQLSQQVDTIVS